MALLSGSIVASASYHHQFVQAGGWGFVVFMVGWWTGRLFEREEGKK
jgi:hypothetical protein